MKHISNLSFREIQKFWGDGFILSIKKYGRIYTKHFSNCLWIGEIVDGLSFYPFIFSKISIYNNLGS